VEAQEMPRILAEAVFDAELNGLNLQCEFKISRMPFCEFVRRLPSANEPAT
jgi:hypothetical protein